MTIAIHSDATMEYLNGSVAFIASSPIGPRIAFAPPDDGFGDSVDSAADEFLRRFKDAEEPSDNESGEEDDEDVTEDEDEDSEDGDDQTEDDESEDDDESEGDEDDEDSDEDEDDGKKKKPAKSADDDAVVRIKVDGKDHEVPVKDLKRLWGQEQSLNRKSEETAVLRKQAEETGAKYVAGVSKLLEMARSEYDPYSKIDFLVAAKELSAEELTMLRTNAQEAYEKVKFLEQELDTTFQTVQTQRNEDLLSAAREAHKTLSDPEKGIKGWSEPLYDELRTYAIGLGMDANYVNRMVDPVAIKMVHKAMLFDKGQKALSTKSKVVTKTAKKVIKSSGNSDANARNVSKTNSKANSAMTRLRSTGDYEDAADAFLSRWQ